MDAKIDNNRDSYDIHIKSKHCIQQQYWTVILKKEKKIWNLKFKKFFFEFLKIFFLKNARTLVRVLVSVLAHENTN
jgi:hypothetical protein